MSVNLFSICQPVSLSDLLEKQYGSADFGSHGCPWECGLRLLYLRGAETGPNGQGVTCNVVRVFVQIMVRRLVAGWASL